MWASHHSNATLHSATHSLRLVFDTCFFELQLGRSDMITRSGMAAVGFLVAVLSDTAWSQPAATDGQGAVSGMGTGELQRLPEVMRMRVVITTKGKDLNEALAGLKDRVAAA